MTNRTLNDIQRYYRCPYEHRLDKLSNVWRITPEECLDLSVHDAVTLADSILLRENRRSDADSETSSFWDSWDRHLPDVDPVPEDSLGLIRFGERCIRNHAGECSQRDGHIVAVGVSATVPLDGDHSVTVPIDLIRLSGQTATVICYRTDSGVRSSDDLSEDMGMLLASRWVLSNISECTRVRMVWMFLGSGVRVEAVPTLGSMVRAMSDASTAIHKMEQYGELLPNESDHCHVCPYRDRCPRKAHEMVLSLEPGSMDSDAGVKLVDEYAEIQERIDALKRRLSDLERRRDAVSERLASYADSNGFMSIKGHGCSALVRSERKVELPEDKGPIIDILHSRGLYDEYSMPNWSRIRSDISKGSIHRDIMDLADISENRKVYFKREIGRRQ